MAGLAALFNSTSPWYVCPNGELIEPVDFLHCLFPNEGRNSVGDGICFVSRPFKFELLQNLLPSPTDYYTPEEFVDGVMSLMVMSVFITVMMMFSKHAWNGLDPRFRSINPPHKKIYVVANITKAILLAMLALSPRYWSGTSRFYHDQFQGIEVKRCGIIYISTDFVSLFLVSKLPKSTLIHHITTSILAVLVISINLKMPGWNGLLGVAKMGILYGLFSSAAFPVNAYLAFRVVYPRAKWIPTLIYISLCTYILCCTLNWSLHLVWLYRVVCQREFSIFPLLYLIAVYFMVKDDIVLIKWLIKGITHVNDPVIKNKAIYIDGKD